MAVRTFKKGITWNQIKQKLQTEGSYNKIYDADSDGSIDELVNYERKRIRVLEEVIDFNESFITITHNNTVVNAGGIEIDDSVLNPGNTTSRTDDDSSASVTAKYGLKITAKTNMNGVRVVLSSLTSGATTAYLLDSTGTTILASATISGGQADLVYDLQANTDYIVAVDAGGASYTVGYVAGTYPVTGADIDIIGAFTGGSGAYWAILSITSLFKVTSASAYVEFNHPSDISMWDLVTYQTTPNGETVTIDIESSTDGVTWTTEFTNITQNFDISTIPASKQVRFKINLSRVNTANNPRVEYLARRFIR